MSLHPQSLGRLRAQVGGCSVSIVNHCTATLGDLASIGAGSNFHNSTGPAIHGALLPFNASEVQQALNRPAIRVASDFGQDVFELDEFRWLIDDAWGVCEVNLVRSSWRAWLMPQAPKVAAMDGGFYWPISQLLARRGKWLMPSVSLVRAGWGALLLGPLDLGPQLQAALGAGYRIVGSRWTLVELRDGGVDLVRPPVLLKNQPPEGLSEHSAGCTAERCAADAVIVLDGGRATQCTVAKIQNILPASAIRDHRPITAGLPRRALAQVSTKLSDCCPAYRGQLSRNPSDLLDVLSAARYPDGTITLSQPAAEPLAA